MTTIDKPFVQRGWHCATDGRICIRLKTGESDSIAQGSTIYPNCDMIFDAPKYDKEWTAPAYQQFMINCGDCRSGKLEVNCSVCEGTGEKWCDHCDNDSPCKKCRGNGFLYGGKCDICAGSGKIDAQQVIFGDFKFDGRYIHRIETLNPLRWTIHKDRLFVQFADGECVLCNWKVSQ